MLKFIANLQWHNAHSKSPLSLIINHQHTRRFHCLNRHIPSSRRNLWPVAWSRSVADHSQINEIDDRPFNRQNLGFQELDGKQYEGATGAHEPSLRSSAVITDAEERIFSPFDGDARVSCETGQTHPTEIAVGHGESGSMRKPASEERKTHAIPLLHASQISRHSFGKVDLTYYNVRQREGLGITTRSRRISPRERLSLRKSLAKFVQIVQPLLSKIRVDPNREQPILDSILIQMIDDDDLHTLHSRDLDIDDLMLWAWVLSGDDASVCVRRYLEVCKQSRSHGRPYPPRFLGLQLLRFDEINAYHLHLMWEELYPNLLDEFGEDGAQHDVDYKAIFLIRMLRHARKVDYGLFEPISQVVPQLLPVPRHFDSTPAKDYIRKLAHFYNRFLSLLALPVRGHPFNAVLVQQQAQLNIVQFMHTCSPEIHINREGYRAFINLQLRHAKTFAEREWAQLKGPRWPPWRQDMLGIQENMVYPGQKSRVMKVLQRMRDAGYGPGEHEVAAQVLSGWDTDMSPTIQVRRVMSRRPLSWIKSWLSPKAAEASDVTHEVWAARVEATRTIREAWSCFYAYMGVTEHGQRKLFVYQRMFDKLLATVQEDQTLNTALPGDGTEVYKDSESDRDRVYVPIEPPTVDELYAQMLGDDIKPAGRLLSTLLSRAPNLKRGLAYINESSLNEVKKEVLLHAEKYSEGSIQTTLRSIPDYLFGSYINLLARRSPFEANILLWPTSRSGQDRVALEGPVRSFHYAIRMLEIAQSQYVPLYNALLEGLRGQINALRKQNVDQEYLSPRSTTRSCKLLLQILEMMEKNGVAPNKRTFRSCAMIGQRMMLSTPLRSGSAGSILLRIPSVIKSLFITAFRTPTADSGQFLSTANTFDLCLAPPTPDRPELQPECKDIELLVFVLTVTNDRESIWSLVSWMNKHHESLMFSNSNARSKRQMLAAIRVALEGLWQVNLDTHESKTSAQADFDRVVELCRPFGWATDEDVEEFIYARRNMENAENVNVLRSTLVMDGTEVEESTQNLDLEGSVDIWKRSIEQ